MITVGLDFETRSRVDLKACGTDVYASDPSTDIICCSFINKHNGQKWLWFAGNKVPADLILCLQLADEVEAHNARFDQLIYEYIAVDDYGFPIIKKEKWVCTAALCRVNALPASLDAATRASNAEFKKDHSGTSLINKLCIPDKKTGKFNYDPALIAKMGKYCMRDSEAMTSMTSKLRPMTAADKRDWQTNERINDRGILVDLEMATLAQSYAADEKNELGKELSHMTDGTITKVTQTKRLLDILKVEFAGHPELMRCITKARKEPTDPVKYTLDKAARGQLLDCEALEGNYRDVIDLIDQGGNSSVSKFTSMLNRADPVTGRVHGAFIFAGASQTTRYSSKGLQLHNMRRDCWSAEQAEDIKAAMRAGKDLTKLEGFSGLTVMDILARLLRPTIIPAKDHKFVVGDWSAIEAMVLPWLSNSAGGEAVLDIFRSGRDIYVETAINMGFLNDLQVKKLTEAQVAKLPERQTGKLAVLSLGFGGAVGALQAMAKNYGVEITNIEAQSIVDRWRKANPWARQFWTALEKAAIAAIRRPKEIFNAGKIRYVFIPEILGGTLMCILPNDTIIQYPYARLGRDGITAMKASVQPKADSDDEWPRMRLWGGFMAENVTQATAACLLRELLGDMVEDDFPVVGHVHDEVILEVHDSEVEQMVMDCQSYMETCPIWAEGLPLSAKPAVMERYGK
jgi:DNA polymerase